MNGTWARGHHRRGPGGSLRSVPNPAAAPAAPEVERPFWEVDGVGDNDSAGLRAAVDGYADLLDRTDPDPDPGYADITSDITAGIGPVEVTPKMRRDIGGMLALIIMLPADLLTLADPYCGEAFNRSAPKMVKSLIPIVAQSEVAVKFLTSQSGLFMWLNFLVSCKPVLTAVIAHHITKRVHLERDEETG